MKVELKLSIDSLIAVNGVLAKVYDYGFTKSIQEKVCKSIGYDLADKFDAKTKTQLKKNSLFEAKKLYKIALKFHEAWALQLILMSLFTHIENDYHRMLSQKVINTIDQKLKS